MENLLHLREGKTYGGCTNPRVIAKCSTRKCVQSCTLNVWNFSAQLINVLFHNDENSFCKIMMIIKVINNNNNNNNDNDKMLLSYKTN